MIEITIPASKSITQRALLLAGISSRPCRIQNPLDCDDSRALSSGLEQLGVRVEPHGQHWLIHPPRRLTVPSGALVLGNAGTAVRFLTGLAPLVPGPYLVDGNQAMRKRPMPGLLATLRSLGVKVDELGRPGCPPIRLCATNAEKHEVKLKAGGSSQELSALLLMGCCMPAGLTVQVDGELPSRPYISLTLEVLSAFGVKVQPTNQSGFHLPHQLPGLDAFRVEGDWSSASYPLAAAWLTGKQVRLLNMNDRSIQGDRAIVSLLEQLDQPGPRRMHLSDAPDIAPTVVACALFAQGSTELSGIGHLRIKESDRIGVLTGELRKLGADLVEKPDGLIINPAKLSGPASLDPANDHRMAMVFGLIALRVPDIQIKGSQCVTKSYPDFWSMLDQFTMH